MSSQILEPQRVRVWFGEHVVVEYVADSARAEQYAEAMGRRFAGLRVTVDRYSGAGSNRQAQQPAPLPAERMWALTP